MVVKYSFIVINLLIKLLLESKVNYSLKEKIKLRREKLNEKVNKLSECREELVVRNREVCQTR
jgi:predicted Holliday junction resolvase-like endonuclease